MKVQTRLFSRTVACALVTLTPSIVAAPARANVLTVTARGTIAPSCSLAPTQNFPSSNFNAAGNAVATASVSCNQLFKVRATSLNGAIKTSAPASGTVTNTLPYSLKADVALDDGSTQSATCASTTLVAGQSSCTLSPANGTGLSSNGQIATNKTTTLTVSWTPPSLPTQLATGSYSDTVTLTVSTAP